MCHNKSVLCHYDFLHSLWPSFQLCWWSKAGNSQSKELFLLKLNYSIGWVRQISRDLKGLLKSNLSANILDFNILFSGWSSFCGSWALSQQFHLLTTQKSTTSRKNSISKFYHVIMFLLLPLCFCFSTKCQILIMYQLTWFFSW